MKKRLMCLILALAALLSGCGVKQTPPPPDGVSYSQEKPLMAAVESQEEAEELAELYGITLVDFGNGIATFYTEENPYEVIKRGEDNGWKLLEINHIQQAFK